MTRKLGRKKDNREHMLRNLVTSLILYEKIKTTEPKAKEVKSIIDRIITIGKKGDLVARRQLLQYVFDANAARKVLEELAPRFTNRQGGYTKLYRLSPRVGDGAPMAILEFIPTEKKETTTKPKEAKPAAKK